MQILKDRIRKDGKIKAGNVLKAVWGDWQGV